MDSSQDTKAESFFDQLIEEIRFQEVVTTLIVTHFVPDRPFFLQSVAKLARIGTVIPKPRSIHEHTLTVVRQHYQCDQLTREQLADDKVAIKLVRDRAGTSKIILLDIGGYFAPSLAALVKQFPNQILGVVEDTENGLQKYEKLGSLPCPVVSVARSPLKNPEDYLVGKAVMFSAEALVRSCGQILQGREAVVFGYGKIGRSIAHSLHALNVRTAVVETNPVRAVEAMAHGFPVLRKREALERCDFLVCATGNLSLEKDDWLSIRNGTFIASVTSSDDELGLRDLKKHFAQSAVTEHVGKYQREGQFFFLLNDGNAVNFVHGAPVAQFIYLVQAEILYAMARLTRASFPARICELDFEDRKLIASRWLDIYA